MDCASTSKNLQMQWCNGKTISFTSEVEVIQFEALVLLLDNARKRGIIPIKHMTKAGRKNFKAHKEILESIGIQFTIVPDTVYIKKTKLRKPVNRYIAADNAAKRILKNCIETIRSELYPKTSKQGGL